jgi:hypothetical protein
MQCHTCHADVDITRRVRQRIKPKPFVCESKTDHNLTAYKLYVQQNQCRTAFVCPGCYRELDGDDGTAKIAGAHFELDMASRCDRAAVYDQDRYVVFQRRAARRLDLPEI